MLKLYWNDSIVIESKGYSKFRLFRSRQPLLNSWTVPPNNHSKIFKHHLYNLPKNLE